MDRNETSNMKDPRQFGFVTLTLLEKGRGLYGSGVHFGQGLALVRGRKVNCLRESIWG